MNTMKWLVKREYWEHKGGFFWAPLIASAIYILMSLVGVAIGQQAETEGFDFNLSHIVAEVSDPTKANEVSQAVQFVFQTIGLMPMVVTIFVVFFYCIGTLYDERKDKSILFWKSLPTSDRDSIFAKLISAIVLAPLIGTIIAIATSFVLFAIISLIVMFKGHSPAPLWNVAGIASGCANLILNIAITGLWALPTIGWLMLCSSWANRVPFLWATIAPILAGIMVSITGIMGIFNLDSGWFWSNIVGRALLGLIPGMEMIYRYNNDAVSLEIHTPNDFFDLFTTANTANGFANPQLWIGAIVGILMVMIAIRMRRYRDDG